MGRGWRTWARRAGSIASPRAPGAVDARSASGACAEAGGDAGLAHPSHVGPQQTQQTPIGMPARDGAWWWLAHSMV